jgi:hypothetical protein
MRAQRNATGDTRHITQSDSTALHEHDQDSKSGLRKRYGKRVITPPKLRVHSKGENAAALEVIQPYVSVRFTDQYSSAESAG